MRKFINKLFIIRLLQRRDAVAFMVAFVLAILIAAFVTEFSSGLQALIQQAFNPSAYLNGDSVRAVDALYDPIVVLVIQVLVLEVLLQFVLRLRSFFVKK